MAQFGSADGPSLELASDIAARVVGRVPISTQRFTTGARHYVVDVAFADHAPVVVRIGYASAHAEIAGAIRLSALLRPRGVALPAILAADAQAKFPWLVLERLQGTDLGAVVLRLSHHQLDQIAAYVAQMQAITAETGAVGRYGYAVHPEQAPYAEWSQVLRDNLARSRRRMASAGLFDLGLVDAVEARLATLRADVDAIVSTPFLHDTTTRNVIVASDGRFSGIVDVDDLCFGDPRYPAALTLAVMQAYGGPFGYVSDWLRYAGHDDDRVFRLYVLLFLLDLMSEHGLAFNGNAPPSTQDTRTRLLQAFNAAVVI